MSPAEEPRSKRQLGNRSPSNRRQRRKRRGNRLFVPFAVYKGTKFSRAFPLGGCVNAIGRDADNAIQLVDPQVSKRHAIIRAKAEVWTIEDAGSTNGLKVNGARVKHAALKHGDRIGIGPFRLVFETDVSGEWVPTHVIDMSSKAVGQTIPQEPAPRPSRPA